jgi:hypothetical protein
MLTRYFLFCLLAAVLCHACEVDRSAELQVEINKRVDRARKQYQESCMTKTLQNAEKLADSLLISEAKLTVNDSLRNRMPYKPLQPAAVAPIDSLKVAPLF